MQALQRRAPIEIYYRKNGEKIEQTYERGETLMMTTASSDSTAMLNIYDCFKFAEMPEVLGEDNAWYCPNCKEFVLASKQMQIYKAPKILILYFKRFKNKGEKGLYKSKIST
jgi:ubiquitin C-terminal hydrolase